MDAIEKIARVLYAMERRTEPWESLDDWARSCYLDDAPMMLAAFPQLALEGREESGTAAVLGYPDDMCDVTRTVWSTEWSEVQS